MGAQRILAAFPAKYQTPAAKQVILSLLFERGLCLWGRLRWQTDGLKERGLAYGEPPKK